MRQINVLMLHLDPVTTPCMMHDLLASHLLAIYLIVILKGNCFFILDCIMWAWLIKEQIIINVAILATTTYWKNVLVFLCVYGYC